MTRGADLLERSASKTLHATAMTMMLLVCIIVVGTITAKTEMVARGLGKIVVSGHSQSIQSQLRGKVAEILVRDGDSVKVGTPLVTLDQTELRSDVERLKAAIALHLRDFATAQAESYALGIFDPSSADFVDAGVNRFSELSKTGEIADGDRASAFISSRLQALRATINETDSEIAQNVSALATQEERVQKATTDEGLVEQRNASAEELQQHGAISRATLIDRTRERRNAESELLIAKRQRDEIQSTLNLIRAKRHRLLSQTVADVRKAISEAELNLRSARADLGAAQHRLENAVIRSPVDGRVEDLKVFTSGGFVDAGQLLMMVVPEGENLEIEAFFENRDAGFLEPGQQALIKLDTFPSERFGYVTGRIITVGADARKVDDVKGWFYAVRIAMDQDRVNREGKTYLFAPGMTGTIDVVTGQRRVITYFFEPIVKAIQDGLKER